MFVQQPHFDHLCQHHVAEQSEQENRPIQRGSAVKRARRPRVRTAATRRNAMIARVVKLNGRLRGFPQRNFVGADDVNDECLGHQRFDEPAGLKQRCVGGIRRLEHP